MIKLLVVLLFPVIAFSQIKNPVSWDYSINFKSENSAEVEIKATIESGWHLYSKNIPPDSGFPTTVTFIKDKNLKLIGETTEEGKLIKKYSDLFEATLFYYDNQVIFKQIIEWEKPLNKIRTEIVFQVCNDKVCLTPEEVSFEIPITKKLNQKNKNTQTKKSIKGNSLKISSIDLKNPMTKTCIEEKTNDSSLITIILLGFFGGFLALLTPCVFPMIPLTVTYFTKSNHKKNALIYALFILMIFMLLSVPFYLIEGIVADIFNQISTNIWVNISFFVVFVFFAFSLFGYYEIVLPSIWVNKSEKASDKNGLVGIFFLALTLVIVSFSCTGPILGTLLVGAIDNVNGAQKLTAALGGFGFSWALVFGGLSLFPNLLSKLPKSGGWLNTIKITLGFVELAMALKFLSKADLVSKSHIITREWFLVIWILVFVGLILALLNLVKLPNNDASMKSNLKYVILFLTTFFIGYLMLGLVKPERFALKTLSGLLPPEQLSIKGTNDNDCPLGLNCVNDYDKAVKMAIQFNKPILLDFTGWGCENCRRMEETVWVEDEIFKILKNEVIITSLYVDDRELLPKNQQIEVLLTNGKTRKLKTVGNKWSVFQAENFNSNSQPQYVLLTPKEELISYPIAGYKSKIEFLAFLECGLNYFNKK